MSNFRITDGSYAVDLKIKPELVVRVQEIAASRNKLAVRLLADVIERSLADIGLRGEGAPDIKGPFWVEQAMAMEARGIKRQIIAAEIGVSGSRLTEVLGRKRRRDGGERKLFLRKPAKVSTIPPWVPIELRQEYAARVKAFGEEEAASWARREKRAKP